MDIKKIINNLNQHEPGIIKVLTASDWLHFKKYFLIKEKYLSKNIDQEFERIFCAFYIMNGARGLNNPQKKEFFKLLSSRENNLEIFFKSLYKISGYGRRHKLFLSFGTKLLHTINEKLPIYDGNIAYVLKLPSPTHPASLEERIKNRMDIYQELKNNFVVLLANKQIKNYLKSIRQKLQSKAKSDKFNWQDKLISDTKLLDSTLWALYSVLK